MMAFAVNVLRTGPSGALLLVLISGCAHVPQYQVVDWGTYPIFQAVERERDDDLRRLLDSGENPNVIGGYYMETPLHVACAKRSPSLIRLLVTNKADPNVRNNQGRTPVFDLFDKENQYQKDLDALPIALRILRSGGMRLDVTDNSGMRPLHWFVRTWKGAVSPDEAQELCTMMGEVAGWVDVKAERNPNGDTLLHSMAREIWHNPLSAHFGRCLVGLGVDPRAVNNAGESALELARKYHSNVLEEFLVRLEAK